MKKYKKWLVLGVGTIIVGVIMVAWWLRDVPSPTVLKTKNFPESSQIFDRNKKLLYEFYGDKRRLPANLDEVPDKMIKATLAIEDTNFYKHWGFDIKGILRGLYRTILQRRLQGGSTITQQLVKNALLTQERTLSRKLKEAVLTVITEMLYDKNQILEMYFNQTPYGGTMWGIKTAAKGVFNKEVKDLSLAEMALLAGLPGSPTKYSPFSHPEAAKGRQELVLDRMESLGWITAEEKRVAKEEKLNYYFSKGNILAPHFVFYIKDELVSKYGIDRVNEGGLKVMTTLDLGIQEMVEASVAAELESLAKNKVTNGAALVTKPKTGEILAMVGSKDYFATDIDGEFNVTTAKRQPGSSIKPLNYAVGIETGKITAASVFNDNQVCFTQAGSSTYCPTNYGNRYFGLQTARNSLGNSLNIPAVKVLKLNGVEAFIASASAMGITTFDQTDNYGLSLTLGGGEVKMIDMNVAFGVLANMGLRQNLTSILKITDKNGIVLEEYQYVPGSRVLSRETSFIIQQMLSDDGARAMVFGRGSMLNIKGHPEVAVKTGTTNEMKDNWTIGYTSDYVTAVWVGNNDNSKMGSLVSGTTGAAPIWNKIMSELLRDKTVKKPTMPINVVGKYVCNLTGELPPEEGCESHYEYFKNEFVPQERVTIRRSVLIDKDSGRIVQPEDGRPNTEWQEHQVVKDVAEEWVCLDCPAVLGSENKTVILN